MTRKSTNRSIQRLLLGVVAAIAALASCDQDQQAPPLEPVPHGDQFPSGFTPRDGGEACTDRQEPGCPCDTEGARLQCGKVVEKLHDRLVCGKGVSVCTLGTWSECALNNSDLSAIPLPESSGLSLQSLGAASSCATNPCDPFCLTFLDSTQGGTPPGTNITVDPNSGGLASTTQPASSCTPRTCAAQGINCGPAGDGCGGVLNCGTCTSPQSCGGAGTPSVCGTPVPPGGPCVPLTCADVGASCGPAADGCGGLLDCGTCTSPQACGGAGTPGVCGTPPVSCTPTTCASLGMNCGPASDSCGGLLNCGTCTSPQTCGGGGIAGVCGPAPCVPKTCSQLGKNCGPVSDGCGGLLTCGTCNWPQTCGGAGTPSVCGTNASCTNLCLQQTTCPGSGTTRVTGTVYAPNGVDPLPNAVVYVPNGTVTPFAPSVSCDNCAQASGSPLVGTTSALDGKFTLNNMPVGSNIPLVIQIGRWRRQVSIPTVTACATTTLPASLTRLPKNQSEGDIPKQAFVTGKVDALECVLRKIGIDDSEFTNPIGNGRIHLYAAGGPGYTRYDGFDSGGVYGAYKGGVGPGHSAALTATGTTEWEHRLLDTHAWLMAAPMAYSRADHAAVLLQDGRVLVAGGFGASGSTASATTTGLRAVEIYDPSTNDWTTMAQMDSSRGALTATLLQNGRVLVTGGHSGSTYRSTAELYNPTNNTWSSAGTMTGGVGRSRHTATLLNSGKVLVVGGTTNGTASTATASVYDPATNGWTATGNAPAGRFYHSATLLSNGKVLIAGGVSSGTTALSTAELYDPATNTFSATPVMPAARQQHTDTRLATGRVLLTGGAGSGTNTIATTAIYDPTANTWSAGASMTSSRRSHSAALLSDGTVAIFGGVGITSGWGGSTTLRTTEETYNPTSNSWSSLSYGYNHARALQTATPLQNGRVLMTGGQYTTGGSLFAYSEVLVNQPLHQYDIALFPCPGAAYYHPETLQRRYQNNLANYANIGGRIFTTHYTYHWIYSDNDDFFSPLSPAIGWNLNQGNPSDQTGYIDQSFSKGAQLAQWLRLPAINASTTLGQIPIKALRRDFNSAPAPTQNWMTINPSIPMHVTFNTPLGVSSSNQCGRVVYSDFHVEDSSNTRYNYPHECDETAMTPQEKLLEFMMFDLASCITPDSVATCVPTTCGALGLNCGQAGDGCGGTLNCGTCASPLVCGWGSTPNVCTMPAACPATTCNALGLECGPAGNGCGGALDCGSCLAPEVCGGGGPGKCGIPTSACVPMTCSALGLSCGPAGDGCGNSLDCGSCTAPETCGGGGQRGQCGSPPACVPTTCSALGLSCGSAGDGCGGTLNCGSCTAPDTCGGGGQPGQCGHTNKYVTGTFVRDYSSTCAEGTSPVWSLWSWNATTPSDSHIDFTVQTAATAAGLASAPSDPLLFSRAPLAGTPASARAANAGAGTPDTQLGSTDVDYTFAVNDRPRNNPHVRITSTLVPTSDRTQTALLTSWNLQMTCVPNN